MYSPQRSITSAPGSGPVRTLSLASGGEGAVRTCAGGDGWPRFVLAARRDRTAVFATGHMTALDLAQRVVVEKLGSAPPPEPTDMRRRIAELEQSVGSSLGLIGMLDIGKIDKLRDLANGYNSLRDYSRAECDFWRTLYESGGF